MCHESLLKENIQSLVNTYDRKINKNVVLIENMIDLLNSLIKL